MTNIMLVDDHASSREPLAFMLEREPDFAVVEQSGSLADARRFLTDRGTQVDVAVIDLGLPDGSGEELIADVRAKYPDATTLVLTYFSDRERLAAAVEAGAAGILHKSASIEEVMNAIRRLDSGANLLSFDDVLSALNLVRSHRTVAEDGFAPVERLTDRERDVLLALAEGMSDKDIAEHFSVGAATVRSHVTNILAKLGATSRLQALVVAVRHGIVNIN
jgi:DNA-binding NarL/FixJ family response regulator